MTAAADAQDAATVPYEGLPWIIDPTGASRLVAKSRTTPLRYVVDYSQEERCTVWTVFAPTDIIDLESGEHPRARLGVFPSLEAALFTAERHDFAFFDATHAASGRQAVFHGSERVQRLAEAIRVGNEDPADFVPGDFICPNGRSFSSAASFFPAKKVAMKQEKDGSWALQFNVGASEVPLWLQEAPMGLLLVLGAVAVGQEEDPDGKAARKRANDALKRCIQMEDEGLFQEWLATKYDRWGLIHTAIQVDSTAVAAATGETLRRLLGIPSRADLRTNLDAVDRLERLDREYYRDLSRGFGAVYRPYQPPPGG